MGKKSLFRGINNRWLVSTSPGKRTAYIGAGRVTGISGCVEAREEHEHEDEEWVDGREPSLTEVIEQHTSHSLFHPVRVFAFGIIPYHLFPVGVHQL